jgi:hypothetical protein
MGRLWKLLLAPGAALLLAGGWSCGEDDPADDGGQGGSSSGTASSSSATGSNGSSTSSATSSTASGMPSCRGIADFGEMCTSCAEELCCAELEAWNGEPPDMLPRPLVTCLSENCNIECLPPAWGGTPPTLTIAECVNSGNVVVPSPGNEGHLTAARLTPPSYPFTVTEVVYELSNGAVRNGNCDAALAHRVEVYVDTAVQPSNTPTLVAQLDMMATAPTMEPSRLVVAPLPMPLVLTAGQHLFVAVEMAGTAENHICVWMCEGTGADDRNYWSNATMAPYDWVTLASYQNPNNLRIGANGMP